MLSTDGSADTSAEAVSLLAAVTKFEFIVALCIVSNITGYLKGISAKLQGREIDIAGGFSQVSLVEEKLQKVCAMFTNYSTVIMNSSSSRQSTGRSLFRKFYEHDLNLGKILQFLFTLLCMLILSAVVFIFCRLGRKNWIQSTQNGIWRHAILQMT